MAQSKFLSLTGLDTYDAKIKDWVEKKGYTTPNGHNHDGRYYTETEVNNLLKDYLKLAGGTISGTLTINRDASAIHYNNSSGTSWGWMGFKAKDTPAVWENTGTTSYNILHAGNSGVSLSGSTLTVKINGTEHSLTNTNTTYDGATQSTAGLMSAADKIKLDGIASGANAYSLPLSASNTRGGIKIGYTESGANIPLQLSSEKGYVTLTKNSVISALGYTPPTINTTYTAGTNISISSSNVISATNTTYDAATQSAAGLMSAADKKKLDGIATGANAYTHPDTHPASIITGLATVATSGSYNDLSNKPTIPTIPTKLPADGGNADTVDNKHASDFMAAGDTSHGTHVTTGAQTWSGTKTFSSEVILNGGGTQTDICSGIAAAFKTKRIMANQIIADSIILGASSGTASNKDLTIQKYGKITDTAPASLTTLLTFDTKGRIKKTSGGSWISARDQTILMQEKTNNSGSSYNPIIGTKTQAGFWSMGSCGGETLYLSYDTDENYNAGNNTSSTILFPTAGRTGTIALTADIPGAATQSAAGLMSADDKKKLDGIDLSGGITKPDGNAGSLQDALDALKTLINNHSADTDKHKDTIYTHPTGEGNKHIPSGGSSGQFLAWSSAGTAKWVDNPNTDTIYTHPTGAGNNHIPPGGSSGQFLAWNSAGTAKWVDNPNTDTNTWRTVQCNGTSIGNNILNLKAGTNVSISNSNGTLTISSTDTDTVYTHPTGAGNNHIPSGGSSGQFLGWSSAGTAKWVNNPNTNTDTNVTSSTTTSQYYLCGCTASSNVTGTLVKRSTVYVNTSSAVCASGGFYETSDERLKNFGEPIEVDLEKIKKLPKKYFTWKKDKDNKLNIGTSAQELQKLYPEIVSEGNDGYLNVNYEKLSIVALAAIDKLQDKYDKKIQELEDKLNKVLEMIK